MKRHSTATTDAEDGLTLKELFGGELPEIIIPEPEAPTPRLESAWRALERGGYVVVDKHGVSRQAQHHLRVSSGT